MPVEKTSSSMPKTVIDAPRGPATKSATQPAAGKVVQAKTNKQITERTHLHQPFIDSFNTFINSKQSDNEMWEGFNWGGIDLRGIKELRLLFVKRAENCAIKAGKETATDFEVIEKFTKFIVYAWAKSDSFSRVKFTPDYLSRKFNEFTGKPVEAKPTYNNKPKGYRPPVADFSKQEEQFTSFT